MRKRYWLAALFTLLMHVASAQNNYCDDLSRDTDAVSKAISWRSPDLNISLKSTLTDTTVQVWANFNIKQQSEFIAEENGLFIRFDDGKSLRFFGQRVTRKYISAREGFFYETSLLLNPKNYEWFKTKKITKFQIAGVDVDIADDLAVQIESYAICMSGMK
ncbi:hypothetical protein [uncultured Mucilaginibacter sp.]|uniref:hypothetical protein n=1 Tax=uncultured Mucilaginibacter sp. TaxID=797541 RepID=UPI0025DDF4D4|nr:hypothetical protein [uncultured Mucilaginibacter sp.]